MDRPSKIDASIGNVAVADFETAVLQRYSGAAQEVERVFACP